MTTAPLAARDPERTFAASFAAMLGICLVIMLIAIDSTVVGTAMPRIIAELRGYSLYQWIASAYLMTNAVLIPIAGRLGDLYGRKPFVLVAVILFTLASAACGLAQSMLQLVFARGLQGVGGGLLVGVAFACVTDLFPDRVRRVRWQAMMSATFGIATAVGPSLGGWLTEHAGWRSVFYVNLPIALLALPMIWRFLPHMVHHEEKDRSIDWLGAVLLAASICGLLLATEQGQGGEGGKSVMVGAAALLCGGLFIWHQHHSQAPIVPARLMHNSGALKLMALGVLTGLSMFVLVFYIPLLLQGGFGQSPKEAGLVMTPLLVCITVGSITNGRLLTRMAHAERMITGGQVVLLAGCLLLTMISPSTPRATLMAVFALCGISLGFQLPNLTLQIQAVVERRDIGLASAMIQTTRMLGSMVGVGLGSVLVNATYAKTVAAGLVGAAGANASLRALVSSPQVLIREQDRDALVRIAQSLGIDAAPLLEHARQGLISGVQHGFIAAAVMTALGIAISLRLPHFEARPTAPEAPGASRGQ